MKPANTTRAFANVFQHPPDDVIGERVLVDLTPFGDKELGALEGVTHHLYALLAAVERRWLEEVGAVPTVRREDLKQQASFRLYTRVGIHIVWCRFGSGDALLRHTTPICAIVQYRNRNLLHIN